jgi:hypothetical protein
VGQFHPSDEAGRSVAVVGDEQVMAGLIEEPAGGVGARRMVEGCADLLDLHVVVSTNTFDAARAGPSLELIVWTVGPSDAAEPFMPRLVAAGSPPPR